jgi:hypothetical protein
MVTQEEKEISYRARAEYSIMDAYQSTGYSILYVCDPDKWPPCAAREVAYHALDGLKEGHLTHESWMNFPGGFPRFLDMFEAAKKAADIEQGESVIDKFSVTMADQILRDAEK